MNDILMGCTPQPLNTPNTEYLGVHPKYTIRQNELYVVELSNEFLVFANRLLLLINNDQRLLSLFKCLTELASILASADPSADARATFIEEIAEELEEHFKSIYPDHIPDLYYNAICDNSDIVIPIFEQWCLNTIHYTLTPFHWEIQCGYGSIKDGASIDIKLFCIKE